MAEFEILISGGHVVDGTGSAPVRADVGVRDGRIAAVLPADDSRSDTARSLLDATGRYVLPGFVDTHVHAEGVLTDQRVWRALLRQGVTTVLLGQDGISYAPGTAQSVAYANRYFGSLNGPPPIELVDGSSVADLLACYERLSPVNVGYFVPAGTVRGAVMGTVDRAADRRELAAMRAYVVEGMAEGALGLSTGLEYVPGGYADTAELIALCQPVAETGGVYVSHLRSYSDRLAEAVAEIAQISAESGAAAHISHFRVPSETGARLLAEHEAAGVVMSFDSYPYDRGSTILAMGALPVKMCAGGPGETLRRLRAERRWLIREWLPGRPLAHAVLSHVGAADYQWAEGARIADAAVRAGVSTAEFVVEILLASELDVTCVQGATAGVSPDDIFQLAGHPRHLAGSDGIYLGSHPHPRGYGAFAYFLGRAIRENNWEWAASHLSQHAAERFALAGRGTVTEGAVADLVLVEPAAVRDRSTYESPRVLAEGVDDVLVGGVPVLAGGEITGATPGRALRRSH